MAGKRRFGRVRKLPSGRWQARYPGPDGIDRPAPDTFRTKTDADVWLSQKETELRRTGWVDPAAGLVPLATYFDEWLADRVLRPRTVALYRDLFRLYLAKPLGGTPLAKITLPVVRTWRADLLGVDAPALQVAKAYRLLRAVMNTAVNEDEIVTRNPCRLRGAGKEHSPERPTLEVAEVLRIADAIQPRYRMMVLLAAFAQLRYSELLGLRRRDITVAEPAFLRVRDSKSDAGIREVAVPAALGPDLSRHLTVFAEAGPDGRVFCGPRGATPTRTNFNRLWKKALVKAEMITPGRESIHFHDLRHTGATLVAESGATLREIMHRVGHSSTRAAMIYQHASKRREVALAASLSDVIDAARSGT